MIDWLAALVVAVVSVNVGFVLGAWWCASRVRDRL